MTVDKQKVIKSMPATEQENKNQWHSINPNYLAAKHFHTPDDTPLQNVVAWSQIHPETTHENINSHPNYYQKKSKS